TCRNRRRHLVGDQIEGKIKRCNAGDRAERKAAHDAPAAGGELLPIERQELAVNSGALLGCHVERKNGALNFGSSSLDRLSGFLRQGTSELLLALGNALRDAAQHALAFEGWQPAGSAESFHCGRNCLVGVLA